MRPLNKAKPIVVYETEHPNSMKRYLPFLAVCALFLPVLQSARGAEASVNLFYDNLNGGNWYEVSDYGYVWQPEVASDPNWRPYTDGYWAYTDQGWTWVSYEDFGWATYHYGRWARLADYGWVWVPGTEWAPAWVSWRTGGDYIGWAPLPPSGGGEAVYEGRPITGQVDVEFGIGPAYYNFVDLRYIGEPVLRDRIFPYERNVTVINNTVNVTNITYNNSTVYNYGPDYATVSRYSVRPIQRLKLERQTADPLQAVKNGNATRVQGNTLVVAAPQKLQKAAGAEVAPKQVKAKIEQPKVEKGWANIAPAEKAKMEQKFKTQNAKNIPKPDIQPSNQNAAAAANAETTGTAAPAAERAGKGKGKGQKAEAASAPAVAASPPAAEQGKGKNKNRVQRAEGAASPPAATGAGGNQNANAEQQVGKRGKNKNRVERIEGAEAAANQPAASAGAEEQPGKGNKVNRHEPNVAPAGAAAGSASERNELKSENANVNASRPRDNAQRGAGQGQGRELQERRREQMQSAPPANNQGAAGAGPGANRARREAAQAAGVGQQQQQHPQQQHAKQQQPQPQPQEQEKQQQQQRGEDANQQKAKAKKKEGEATPVPQ